MQLYKNTSWKELKLNSNKKAIPENWNKIKIGNIIKSNDKSKLKASEGLKNGLYPFFNCSETQTKFNKTFLVDGENIFITTGGDYMFNLYLNGKAAYSTDVWSVKIENNYTKFINYFLKYNFLINQEYFRGFKFKHLDKKGFKNMEIPLPPLEEQIVIESTLSAQESIILKIKNLIENIEKRNQFMINELLSGRLRIKKENGHTVLFKNPDDNWQNIKMNGENVKIPKDWYKSNLKKQSNIQSEKPKNNLQYLEIGDIDVRTKKYNLNGKEKTKASAMKFVPLNTFLITTVRPTRLGFTVTEEDLNVSSAFVKITSKTQEFLTFQLYTIDYLRFLESNQNGATYPTIKEDVLLSFEFGMPPEHEINFISKVLKELFIEKEKYEKILEKEEKTFTFLLDELMSGKLRIKI